MTQIELLKSSEFWEAQVLSNPALIPLTIPRTNKYITTTPTINQSAFLLLTCKEALFGGAAGGGKSETLLTAGLQYVDVPGYAALILRRTYADLALPGALMDRAHERLDGTDAHWSEQDKTWTFPGGATLTFGYLQAENDKYRYQSSEFQYIAFDELTQFTQTQYTYMFSRLRRREGSPVPLRMRAGSNPGGTGHQWVKQRFIVEGRTKGRVFIPSKLSDNPHIDQAAYIASLGELDSVTKQRLLDGDWEVGEAGSKFDKTWFEVVEHAPSDLKTVRYWDLAGTEVSPSSPDPDWTSGLKLGRSVDGIYYVLDVQRCRKKALGVEQLVRHTASRDGRDVRIGIEQEPGSSGKAVVDRYVREVLDGYPVKGYQPTGDKVTRATPVATKAEARLIKLVRGAWIDDFLDELSAFPHGGHDDQVDTLSGAYGMLTQQGVGFT